MRHPEPIRRLIEAFLILPGIGRRTAERFAYALLQTNPTDSAELTAAIAALMTSMTLCQRCGQPSESQTCALCSDTTRDATVLCLVSDGRYIPLLEATGKYRGYYFSLGGHVNPLDGVDHARLRMQALVDRLKSNPTKELVLALSQDTNGDATALFVKRTLMENEISIRITRLARGLSTGAQLEYADEATLSSALVGRHDL